MELFDVVDFAENNAPQFEVELPEYLELVPEEDH